MNFPTPSLPPRVLSILKSVAQRHELTVPEILSRSHQPALVAARREAAIEISGELKLSQSQIARTLGLHHTTINAYLASAKPEAPIDWSKPDESGVWAI